MNEWMNSKNEGRQRKMNEWLIKMAQRMNDELARSWIAWKKDG